MVNLKNAPKMKQLMNLKKHFMSEDRERVVMEEGSVPVPASSQSSSGLRLMGSGDGGDDVARERDVASFSTQANALLRKNLTFRVILNYLVYEKQQKLKIMMKMHGLTDRPYRLISYLYFLLLSAAYMICFVVFGSLIVIGYIYVFGSGLLATFILQFFVQDPSFPSKIISQIHIQETIGNPKELKGRYGGSYVFTMATSAHNSIRRLHKSCQGGTCI